jgi:predicted RNase H-like HicB family nuclease
MSPYPWSSVRTKTMLGGREVWALAAPAEAARVARKLRREMDMCASGIINSGQVDQSNTSVVYEIRAQWDGEAGVWVAESEDVPGLVAEADSPNGLVAKLRTLIPELLELNGVASVGTVTFHVLYEHEDSAVVTF